MDTTICFAMLLFLRGNCHLVYKQIFFTDGVPSKVVLVPLPRPSVGHPEANFVLQCSVQSLSEL